MTTRRSRIDAPFDNLEETFRSLCRGPDPLAIDGLAFDELPDRLVPLDELRSLLLHASTPYTLRDAVLGDLVERAQGDSRWMVGLAGVLLPGLRRAAWPLSHVCLGASADVEAETLACFVAAARQVDPHRPRLASHLIWLAHGGAKRLVRAEMAEWAKPPLTPVSAAPPRPWGHPDLVLAKAVSFRVIALEDAELIGATRVDRLPLEQVARNIGITYPAARKRRSRAERTLVGWLRSDDYPIGDFVPNRSESRRSSGVTHPRPGRPRERRPEQRPSDPSTRR